MEREPKCVAAVSAHGIEDDADLQSNKTYDQEIMMADALAWVVNTEENSQEITHGNNINNRYLIHTHIQLCSCHTCVHHCYMSTNTAVNNNFIYMVRYMVITKISRESDSRKRLCHSQ